MQCSTLVHGYLCYKINGILIHISASGLIKSSMGDFISYNCDFIYNCSLVSHNVIFNNCDFISHNSVFPNPGAGEPSTLMSP